MGGPKVGASYSKGLKILFVTTVIERIELGGPKQKVFSQATKGVQDPLFPLPSPKSQRMKNWEIHKFIMEI